MAHEGNKQWMRKWLRFQPHQIIGDDDPYLLRWHVVPRNRFLNVYLHKFCRSDDDRAHHSHPWSAVSLILRGGYFEHRDGRFVRWRPASSLNFLTPKTFHRVELDTDRDGREKPCWTLFVTGPRRGRTWFFKCPQGLVEWTRFVHQNGCGES